MGGNVKESFNCQYTTYLFKKDIYIYIYHKRKFEFYLFIF